MISQSENPPIRLVYDQRILGFGVSLGSDYIHTTKEAFPVDSNNNR